MDVSADHYHLLIDAVADYAIYMLDLDGRVMSWNAGAERLFGFPADAAIRQPYHRFFLPEDLRRGIPADIINAAMANDRYETEGWRLRKDGSKFWSSAVMHKAMDRRGCHIGYAEVARDITEKKAGRDELLEAERRFRMLVEGVIDYAIYMLDPSGIVVNWNAGAARIKGYAAAEIVGQHFSRFYTQEDRAAGLPARALAEAANTGRFEAEGWRVRKDGSLFWAAVVVDAIHSPTGTLIGFAKITRDMTERKLADQSLRDSERQFRLLVNGVTDYALYMLDPNGNVTSWNAGAERIKGYKAGEIIGQHFSKFYTETDRAAGKPTRALSTSAAEGRFEAEAWRVRKDGSLFWANVVIDPIRDEHGVLLGFSKITRDITERFEAQKALQLTQAQISQMQKMDALGQLTGGVAHDFNNLLMVISGFTSSLRRRVKDDPKALSAVDAIETAAKRGATLTHQLLSFSRRQSLSPAVVDLASVVEDVHPILTSLLGNGVKYAATIPPDTWPIKVDANELQLAIINLAVNARDAMPTGGAVTLSAENTSLSKRSVSAGLEGDFVSLTVADIGQGMPPDILAKVFDPFFTTKGVGKGTGLGLSQVHGFVHQSGGTVEIDSKLDGGTRVTIYLPRAIEPADRKIEEGEGITVAGRKILLVEDNPDVAEATKALLADLACDAHVAVDALQALGMLNGGKFDLVLSDIVMAGPMNGLDLARKIRAEHPDLPIVLATGYSEPASLAAGEFPVLRKPYDVSDLHRAIAGTSAQPLRLPPNVVDFREAKGRSDNSR